MTELDLRGVQTVCFDLDGTLIDSSPLHERAFRTMLAEEAPEFLATFRYDTLAGMTTEAALHTLGLGGEAPALARRAARKRAAYRSIVSAQGAPAFAGAGRLLERLVHAGRRCCVVTSASRESARTALDRAGLMHWIRGLVAAEDVARSKPAPDAYHAALREFAAAAHEVLAVEDADAGIAAARAAGLAVVCVHRVPTAPVPTYSSLEDLDRAFAEVL